MARSKGQRERRAGAEGYPAQRRGQASSFDQAMHDATLFAFATALAFDRAGSAFAREPAPGDRVPDDLAPMLNWRTDGAGHGWAIDFRTPWQTPTNWYWAGETEREFQRLSISYDQLEALRRLGDSGGDGLELDILPWLPLRFVEVRETDGGVVVRDTSAAGDRYVFTDRSGRASTVTLSDTNGGVDTIDASSVSTDSAIDLTPGSTSTIGGTDVTIAAGTVIENAIGGSGNDTITGNSAANVLSGGQGDDTLRGAAGDDTLLGGTGDDVLAGGAGSDTLSGGRGSDTFRYEAVSDVAGAKDRIVDFQTGTDVLDFSSMDASTIADGTQDFVWKGDGEFTAAGQLRYATDAGNAGTADDRTFVYGNLDGDTSTIEFTIELSGIKPLTIDDLLL